ncbi:MAG: hypothetical protein EYC70_01435 [Planctomycetota bacterium]|nr:MAG: hypothetical protein EYC70_01435 [Planctomycetota bacterium]
MTEIPGEEKPGAERTVNDLREKIARLEERQAHLRWLFGTLLAAAVGLSALSNFVLIPNTVERQFAERQVEGVIRRANEDLQKLEDALASMLAGAATGVAKDGDLVRPPSRAPADWLLFLGAVESGATAGGGAVVAKERTPEGWKIRAQVRQPDGVEPINARVHYLLLPVVPAQLDSR